MNKIKIYLLVLLTAIVIGLSFNGSSDTKREKQKNDIIYSEGMIEKSDIAQKEEVTEKDWIEA